MTKDVLACLGFSLFVGIGPYYFHNLVQKFKSPSKAFTASPEDLKAILTPKLLNKFLKFRNQFKPQIEWERLQSQNIGYIAGVESQYPASLKQISDPPIGLFFRGDWSSINWKKEIGFVIVGTRKPTAYGRKLAQEYAQTLASAGLVIISGLAIGIDACAHQGVLLASGKTVAVLGCGLNVIYPQANYFLYQRIIKNKGLAISEFPPDQTTTKGLFISRNRIISGLSQGVLVVEGSKKSGTLITAKYAAEQGRDVYAIPGQIGAENAEAPLLLLKQGANLVTAPEDILMNLNLPKKSSKAGQDIELENFPKDQQKLISCLQTEPRFFEELQSKTQFSITQLNQKLSYLELVGVVSRRENGQWQTNL